MFILPLFKYKHRHCENSCVLLIVALNVHVFAFAYLNCFLYGLISPNRSNFSLFISFRLPGFVLERQGGGINQTGTSKNKEFIFL